MLIGELAKATATSKDTIRHYTELGLLEPTQIRAGSRVYNEFSQLDAQLIQWIKTGKSLGFTLGEMRPYLTLFINQGLTTENLVRGYSEKLAEVEDRIAGLQPLQRVLKNKLAAFDAAGPQQQQARGS